MVWLWIGRWCELNGGGAGRVYRLTITDLASLGPENCHLLTDYVRILLYPTN